MINKEKERNQSGKYFPDKLVIANIGIRPFYESLQLLNANVIQVDWVIPGGGDQEIIKILDDLLD